MFTLRLQGPFESKSYLIFLLQATSQRVVTNEDRLAGIGVLRLSSVLDTLQLLSLLPSPFLALLYLLIHSQPIIASASILVFIVMAEKSKLRAESTVVPNFKSESTALTLLIHHSRNQD